MRLRNSSHGVCTSSTKGCISHSPPPLRGAPCDSLFKTLTFLSLALACTLSTNENKFSSVNVSRREPRFRFPCRGGPREPQSSVFALRTPWLAPPVLLGAYYEIGGRQAPALRVNQRSALYIINATR